MAPNFSHRKGKNTRYNLRGHAVPAPIVYHQTAEQIASDRIASRIKKDWPITRNSKRTRGLERQGMSCFRLSGMQGLLHLPKFLNWILSHNSSITDRDGTRIQFPCRPLKEVGQAIADSARYAGASPIKLKDCPACVVKRFVEEYWGQTDLYSEKKRAPGLSALRPEHLPKPFLHRSQAMKFLGGLDKSLQSVTSGTGDDEQQDPSEFQVRILQACRASTIDPIWTIQFQALFEMRLAVEWICTKCENVTAPPGSDPLSLGIAALSILYPDDGPDSIDDAIRRKYDEELFDGVFDCTPCGSRQGRIERTRLNVVPELLRIGVVVQMTEERARVVRGEIEVETVSIINPNPVDIPLQLDLTEHQAVVGDKAPLHYQLESVLSHSGTMERGHWVATVSGPTDIFTADDHEVLARKRTLRGRQVRDKAFLKSNPQQISDLEMTAVILTYSRVRTRRV